MKKIVVTEFMSLDGVFEDPGGAENFKYGGWTMQYGNDEFGKFKFDELQASDALLLGRITYEGFAKAWPSQKDDMGFADKFNNMPKYVISKTLKKAEWTNSHIISDNIAEEIKKLKDRDGKDIYVHGSGTLVRFLIENKLVNEMNIMVYPVVLGTGKQLFQGINKTEFKLIETIPFKTGVVVLRYKV